MNLRSLWNDKAGRTEGREWQTTAAFFEISREGTLTGWRYVIIFIVFLGIWCCRGDFISISPPRFPFELHSTSFSILLLHPPPPPLPTHRRTLGDNKRTVFNINLIQIFAFPLLRYIRDFLQFFFFSPFPSPDHLTLPEYSGNYSRKSISINFVSFQHKISNLNIPQPTTCHVNFLPFFADCATPSGLPVCMSLKLVAWTTPKRLFGPGSRTFGGFFAN